MSRDSVPSDPGGHCASQSQPRIIASGNRPTSLDVGRIGIPRVDDLDFSYPVALLEVYANAPSISFGCRSWIRDRLTQNSIVMKRYEIRMLRIRFFARRTDRGDAMTCIRMVRARSSSCNRRNYLYEIQRLSDPTSSRLDIQHCASRTDQHVSFEYASEKTYIPRPIRSGIQPERALDESQRANPHSPRKPTAYRYSSHCALASQQQSPRGARKKTDDPPKSYPPINFTYCRSGDVRRGL